jgi:predicted RNA binding protein YcfA (HicA-like mRNA interferase family)
MKLPRGLTGDDLIEALRKLGYVTTRQTGSHVRLSTLQPHEHHVTIPRHFPLRAGTLSAILADVATHAGIARDDLMQRLFG